MCQYLASDRFVDNHHFVHLGSRAFSSEGLIITKVMMVSQEERFRQEIWVCGKMNTFFRFADLQILSISKARLQAF
jgi:2,4-dienoyl-CoA reductase-like NADH-dependent reductase (Old Yellow Enzyme family)